MKCLSCSYEGEFKFLRAPAESLNKKFEIAFCPRCGLGETLAVTPDDLQRINQLNYDDIDGRLKTYYRDLNHHLQIRYLEMLRFISHYQEGNRLLEVGSNIGFTLNLARSKGYDAEGCELNEKAREFCRNIYGIGVDKDLFGLKSVYDIVVMNDVLEHFPEPLKALQKVHELLNEKGVLFIQLPNSASKEFQHKKENWKYLSVPDHTFHFTAESLKIMAKNCGLLYQWHRTVASMEDFKVLRILPQNWSEKLLSFLNTNPWYWPRFYERKKDNGNLLQMIFTR